MKTHLTTLCIIFLYSCQGKSNNNYSQAERSVINYLTQKLGKDANYEPLTFGKLDTVYVKDTLKAYLAHLGKELAYDSLVFAQIQQNYEEYQINYISDKLLAECSMILREFSVKKELLQRELDSLQMILPKIPQRVIAYYQLLHQYKFEQPIKKTSISFTLDTNFQVMESRLLADIRGDNGRITIQQKSFYDYENKRICHGRVLSSLRLNGVLLPLEKKITLNIKTGRCLFSWRLPHNPFDVKYGFVNRQKTIKIESGKRYFFVGTYQGVYKKDMLLGK